MSFEIWLTLLIGVVSHLLLFCTAQDVNGKVVTCYMVASAAGRQGAGRFGAELIDTKLCTHVIYAFMGLDESTNKIVSIEEEYDRKELPKLKNLKKSNSSIKVLLSVGGSKQGSKRFSDMANDKAKREIFISSVMEMLKKYELDGLDLCWQFPTQKDGQPYDKENVLTLLRELRDKLHPENMLLTIHVMGVKYVIDSYDIKAVSEIVDLINFAAMGYHGPWEPTTAPTTPLTSSDELNVKFNLDYILKKGVAPNKLLLGLPTYGHSYVFAESYRGQYMHIYYDHSDRSQWTNEPGLMGYHEVCYEMKVNSEGWNPIWDDFSQTPIAYNGRNIVFYDDIRSLLLKAKLVKKKNLRGVMIWSLDTDDFRGICHNKKKYPLLSAITNFINKDLHVTTTTPATDTGNEQLPSVAGNESVVVSIEYGSEK